MGVARRSTHGSTPQTLAEYGEAMEANPQPGVDGDSGQFFSGRRWWTAMVVQP